MTVFRVCGHGKERHATYCNVLFCPICGAERDSASNMEMSRFLEPQSRPTHWTEPQRIGFKNCSNVFHVLFDSFLILISDRGECAVFRDNNLVDLYALNLNRQEKILSLIYGLKKLVFLTNKKSLYQLNLNSLFQQGQAEKVGDNVSAFAYDYSRDNLAYAQRNKIVVQRQTHETEHIAVDGTILQMILKNDYLFYAAKEAEILYYLVESLSSGQLSRKTITLTNNPDTIAASANDDYLSVAIKKGNRVLLTAGKWRNLSINAANWDEVQNQGILHTLRVGAEDLVFIQFADRIEVKDINNITAGIMNQVRQVPDMTSQDLCISLDGKYISIGKRGSSNAGHETSQIYLLSKNLREEYTGLPIPGFMIESYSWVNGLLAAVLKRDGEFMLSRETINEQ
jgi:hypothetical protein